MSASEKLLTAHLETLIARSAPGVEIKILNGEYQVVARGSGEVRARLAAGIYMINGEAGGQVVQQVVRVLPNNRAQELELPAPQGLVAAALEKVSVSADNPLGRQLATDAPRPSEAEHGAEVAVVIRDQCEDASDAANALRLLDDADAAMRSDRADVKALQAEVVEGVAARLYDVTPGEYRLQYVSMTGDTMHQTVPALPGRRTVVFMRAGRGQVLRADGDSFTRVDYRGVNPAATVIISISEGESLGDATEHIRVAELLLHDLAAGKGSLDDRLVEYLGGEDCDPLLLAYAACSALQQLELNRLPSAGGRKRSGGQSTLRAQWNAKAAEWLRRAEKAGVRADVQAARWRLRASGFRTPVRRVRLASPPMLECCWLWAAAHSVHEPRAIPPSVAFRGAVRGAVGASPWLAWRASAAKSRSAKQEPLSEVGLNRLTMQAAAMVNDLASRRAHSRGQDPLDVLSPDARTLALCAQEAVALKKTRKGFDAVEHLAVRLAAPAPVIAQRLKQLVDQLEAAKSQETSATPSKPARSSLDAPGLRNVVTHPDDPHKGRFGKRSELNGFRLDASFDSAASRSWIRIHLVVSGPAEANGERIFFYLHDSFDRDRYAERFKEGRASLTLTSWGGFTVGVWIPGRELQLELDLAEHPRAPRIVREL